MKALFSLWLAATAAGFWAFSWRYAAPVVGPEGAAAPEQLPASARALLHPEETTVFLAWNPDCPCTQADEPHLKALMKQHPRAHWVILTPDATPAKLAAERGFKGAVRTGLTDELALWASPGALVATPKGEILYRGGVNAFRFCQNPSGQLLRLALEAAEEGSAPQAKEGPFYGCPFPGSRRTLGA
jgi:hypothetical protein